MLIYALSGLLAGGLLNMASDRLPPDEDRCPSCQALLPWRRPFLALATALLFARLWQRYGPTLQLSIASFYTCALLLVLVIDLEHRLVLNKVILPVALVALLASLIPPYDPGFWRALLGGALNFGILYLAAVICKGGMGAGDVKLAGLIGLMTGHPGAIKALTIGILLGGLAALFLLITRVTAEGIHSKSRKSYIPYAPFLATGGIVVLLCG